MSTKWFFKCHPVSNKLVFQVRIHTSFCQFKETGPIFKLKFLGIRLTMNITCRRLVLVSQSVTQKPRKEDLRELKS